MLTEQQPGAVVADGDPAFWRVDTRTPAHELPKGVCADATNKRFEDGRAWPRLAVQQGAWGCTGVPMVPVGTKYSAFAIGGYVSAAVNGFVVGQSYFYAFQGNATWLETQTHIAANNVIIPPGTVFVATQTQYTLESQHGRAVVTAQIYALANEQGCTRFTDPNGYDTLVVATDDWRTGAGEDGGRGRVWKVIANNAPEAVPLNGQDVYGLVQLVPCNNGLVLLRQDNERHYFQAAAVGNPAANQIQLNCAPAWNDGDQVYLWGDVTQGSAFNGTSAPVIMSFCFVKRISATVTSLYADSGLTQRLNFASATGRFYLERRAANPGLFGNTAPPLLAQPNATGNSLWEVGFNAVPATVAATGNNASNVWTAAQHRLLPGDQVTLAGMAGGDTPANGSYYAYPLSVNTLYLFDTQAHALAAANGSNTGVKAIAINNGSVPTMTKNGASGLPMPPATGGFYTETNRLVLFNGNTLLISDPLDPLHYSPMSATLTANLGESDAVVAVCSFIAADCVVILKRNSVMALYNFSQGPNSWALRSVTRQYGCVAAKTVRPYANRLVFMSRRGLDSVEFNAFGTVLPIEKPISFAMKKYVDRIDWLHAAGSVVETWNDRLFWGLPVQGNGGIAGQNNTILTLNFLNSNMQQDEWGWEGQWTGANLTAAGLARHTVEGDERLALVSPTGLVSWFGEGVQDTTLAGTSWIPDSLTTRVYSGGNQLRKIWQSALCVWDHNNPTLTVKAGTEGYNSGVTVTPPGGLTYSATVYVNNASAGQTYNPATQQPAFGAPGRDDYAIQQVTELIGGTPDVLQNKSQAFRLRRDAWGLQLTIANSTGQCRIISVNVGGYYGPSSERKRV